MKIKRCICGALAFLSFVWLIGVAGNSDLGLESDFVALVIKVLVVFASILKIGGLINV